MPKRRFSGVTLPAALAALPLVVQSVRALTFKFWLWGDQALIDVEARDSLLGRNLVGVYDRYGWHHLGPLWLLLLGVFRWAGHGSASALVFGSGLLLAAAAAAIVVLAHRLRPGAAPWSAALLVLGYEWAFGSDRLGTVWAPYAIALPAALLVLLVACAVTRQAAWPYTVGVVICASFLAQTDISTLVVVVALVVCAPFLRRALGPRQGGRRAWTFRGGRRAAELAGVIVVLWLPPLINLAGGGPVNPAKVLSFMTSHPGNQPWAKAFQAMSSVVGAYPFQGAGTDHVSDAAEHWLVSPALWDHPWFVLYLAGTAATLVIGTRRRQPAVTAISAATLVAMGAGVVSAHLVYGPLYPYLVYWMSAFTIPAWLGAWYAIWPIRAPALRPPALRPPAWALAPWRALGPALAWDRRTGLALPGACALVAVAITAAFTAAQLPMAGREKALGRLAWRAVAPAVEAPAVRTVYIDMASADAMPDAAAIADMAVRKDKKVEVDRASLYFLDPSFTPRAPAQLDIVVCCGRHDRALLPPGMKLRLRVGGQGIYTGHDPDLYLNPVRVSPHGTWAFGGLHRHRYRLRAAPHEYRAPSS